MPCSLSYGFYFGCGIYISTAYGGNVHVIIMCTFSFVINVYMSIMIFLFIFIAGWLKIASFQEKEEIFGIFSFLSVLLSTFIMLPALLSIMRSSRGADLLQQLDAYANNQCTDTYL